jgi:hypothetical protein
VEVGAAVAVANEAADQERCSDAAQAHPILRNAETWHRKIGRRRVPGIRGVPLR